jgi:hypothetical protein
VALFEIDGVRVTTIALVEIKGPLEAGHAAHPGCYTPL